MRRSLLAAAAAVFAFTPLAPHLAKAQSPAALAGKWSIEYERGRRMENGEATVIMGKGTVTIAAQGDGFAATFESGARPDGSVPPPSTALGTVKGDSVVFVQEQTVTINLNGESREAKVTLTWTFSAAGDTLGGSLARELPGMPEPLPASPVKGTRMKG